MIKYIVAIVLSIILGQLVNHFIKKVPEFIEDEFNFRLVFKSLKQNFKLDYIYSIVLSILLCTLIYFTGLSYYTYIYGTIITVLVITFAIDSKMQLIPDMASLAIFLVGCVNLVVNAGGWKSYLFGMLAGVGSFLLLVVLAKIIYKKEGMGLGDVKLMGALGLVFGLKSILVISVTAFSWAAVVSIILILLKIKKLDSYIPFAPFIAIATLLIILFGSQMFIDIYYNFCSMLGERTTDFLFKIIYR